MTDLHEQHRWPAVFDRTFHAPIEVGPGRRALTDELDRHGCCASSDDVALVMDELVSNALLHGRPPVHVEVLLGEDMLVMSVTDAGEGFGLHARAVSRESITSPLPSAEGGRGLWLASRLAGTLTLTPTRRGFVAEATFPIEPDPQ